MPLAPSSNTPSHMLLTFASSRVSLERPPQPMKPCSAGGYEGAGLEYVTQPTELTKSHADWKYTAS